VSDALAAPFAGLQTGTLSVKGSAGSTPPSDSADPESAASSGQGAGQSATTPPVTTELDAAAAELAARARGAAESETLTEQGVHLSKTARWRAAIEPLRRATDLDPTNVAAFYYLGDAYNHIDSLPAALEAFEAAARLQSDHWRALKGVGIVLDRMRRPQEAAAAYQRAREAQSKTTAR
jgi:tetratricopeptide (TPR) repeat protein